MVFFDSIDGRPLPSGVFFWVAVKVIFARFGAEVICSVFVVTPIFRIRGIKFHAAYHIKECFWFLLYVEAEFFEDRRYFFAHMLFTFCFGPSWCCASRPCRRRRSTQTRTHRRRRERN